MYLRNTSTDRCCLADRVPNGMGTQVVLEGLEETAPLPCNPHLANAVAFQKPSTLDILLPHLSSPSSAVIVIPAFPPPYAPPFILPLHSLRENRLLLFICAFRPLPVVATASVISLAQSPRTRHQPTESIGPCLVSRFFVCCPVSVTLARRAFPWQKLALLPLLVAEQRCGALSNWKRDCPVCKFL
jgi:hypothetical protein